MRRWFAIIVLVGVEEEWTFDEEFVRSARFRETAAQDRLRRSRQLGGGRNAPTLSRAGRRRRARRLVAAVGAAAAVVFVAVAPQAQPARDWLVANAPGGGASGLYGSDPELGLAVDGSTLAVPPLPDDAQAQPLGAVPDPPPGQGGYVFLATRDEATPVAFDPCRPIHIVTNDALAPADAQAHLQRALSVMSAASGFQFVVDGPSDEPPTLDRPAISPQRYGDRWAPVLVAWTSPQQVPDLTGDTMGLGGASIYDGGDPDRSRYVSGVVYLDAPQIAELPAAERDSVIHALLLHELGHLLGLGHVEDATQIMHTESLTATSLGDGDQRGLALLGRSLCPTDT